jgi:hypothetical protein
MDLDWDLIRIHKTKWQTPNKKKMSWMFSLEGWSLLLELGSFVFNTLCF